MSDTEPLSSTDLPAGVRLESSGELPHLDIDTPLCTATVYAQGAHITAWHPAGVERRVLWTSAHSGYRPGKAIRGGVPVCFPWFGPHSTDASAPSHGFARTRPWRLLGAEVHDDEVTLRWELAADTALSPAWPHPFRLVYDMTFGRTLALALHVTNAAAHPVSFEEALHSYFAVGDVRRIAVSGLERTAYLDKVEGGIRCVEGEAPIRFSGETDRVYVDTQATCVVEDASWGRAISIAKRGSAATVVWNPWIERAKAFADFGDDEWQEMVCVETANVAAAGVVTVAPGATHTMNTIVEVRS